MYIATRSKAYRLYHNLSRKDLLHIGSGMRQIG